MKAGDVVRLKQAMRPELSQPKIYHYGIVIKVINADGAMSATPTVADVLVHLYDPESREIYTDELGAAAVYSFRQDEVERL